MCDIHYSIYKRDNSYRFGIGKDTKDFKIYKNCKTYICKSKILSELKDIPKYCDKCKNRV